MTPTHIVFDSLCITELSYDDIEATIYVPIDAHCASADLRVRVYLKKIFNTKIKNKKINYFLLA